MIRTVFVVVIISLSFLVTGCKEDVQKRTIHSEDKGKAITVIHFGDRNKTYLINEQYGHNTIPGENYILNNHSVLENFIGLVEWTDSTTVIYTQYGEFDTSNAGDDFYLKRISTKEFEEMKKDTVRYKYFYQ